RQHRFTRRCLLLFILVALASPSRAPARKPSRTLTVFAASSLTDAFNALKPVFERTHPGVTVQYSFGASSTLRLQIEQGAPADVFASADSEQMQPLVRRHLVLAPQTFARNHLVVAIPAANPGKVRSVPDLARPGLRLVTTNPAVPIGRYTRQVLD